MPEIYFPNLGIKINHLSRIALNIFGVDVYWYGLIIVSAIVIGYFAIDYTLKKRGDSIDNYLTFIMIELICSFIGARTYYIIFSWDYYKNDLTEIFNFRNGGLGVYGGILTACIVAIIYCKVTKKNLGYIVDLFAPYLALGQAMGRWGNFFNREAFGGISNGLFAMALRKDTIRSIPDNLVNSFVTYFDTDYLQVQPTFLYESVCCLIIFILLLFLTKKKHFNGQILLEYLIMYSFARFFIEGLRTDQLLLCNIPISQIVAATLFILSIILLIVLSKKHKNENKK